MLKRFVSIFLLLFLAGYFIFHNAAHAGIDLSIFPSHSKEVEVDNHVLLPGILDAHKHSLPKEHMHLGDLLRFAKHNEYIQLSTPIFVTNNYFFSPNVHPVRQYLIKPSVFDSPPFNFRSCPLRI